MICFVKNHLHGKLLEKKNIEGLERLLLKTMCTLWSALLNATLKYLVCSLNIVKTQFLASCDHLTFMSKQLEL